MKYSTIKMKKFDKSMETIPKRFREKYENIDKKMAQILYITGQISWTMFNHIVKKGILDGSMKPYRGHPRNGQEL